MAGAWPFLCRSNAPQVWNAYGDDWAPTDFRPLSRLTRLRQLRLEALPPQVRWVRLLVGVLQRTRCGLRQALTALAATLPSLNLTGIQDHLEGHAYCETPCSKLS